MRTRRIAVPPGAELAYVAEDWAGSLVVVEEGRIELESRHGARQMFEAGSTLWLQCIPLRALRNPGGIATVLVATSRRRRPSLY